jgi:hypothetical protein
VIDISPPINTIETLDPGPVFRPAAGEKDDPGSFAEILAGLLRDARDQEAAGPESPPTGAEPSAAGERASRDKPAPGKGTAPGEDPAVLEPSPAREKPRFEEETAGEIPGADPALNLAAVPAGLAEPAAELVTDPDPAAVPVDLAVFSGGGDFPEAAGTPAEDAGPAGETFPGEGPAAGPPAGADWAAAAMVLEPAGAERPAAPEEKTGPARKKEGEPAPEEPPSRGSGESLAGFFSGEAAGETRTDPAENRPRDKRRDRPLIEVRDLRTGSAGENRGPPRTAGEGSTPTREVLLRADLSAGERGRGAETEPDSGPARSFRDILTREGLRDDLVRHASVMLRDGGEGTIRLALKPESLGNVKIRLEMTENKISGKIIVETDEALRAFEHEIRALEQAFRDSGFDGASLEMALNAGGGGNGADRRGEEGRPFFSERNALRQAAAGYDAAAEQAGEEPALFAGGPSGSVRLNMLV